MKKKTKTIGKWFLLVFLNLLVLILLGFVFGTMYMNFVVVQLGETPIWFNTPFVLVTFFTVALLWIMNIVLIKVFKMKKPITWV